MTTFYRRKKIRKNLERAADVWANDRCLICEILIVDSLDEVPDFIQHPRWHLNNGGGVCALCAAEEACRFRGINPSHLDSEEARITIRHTLTWVRALALLRRYDKGNQAVGQLVQPVLPFGH